MGIEADRSQWYVRWFFWSQGILDEFTDNNRSWDYQEGINLCPFMRTVFIWTPAVLLLHAGLYAAAILSLTAAPIYFFGWDTYETILTVTAAAAFLIALVVYGLKALDRWLAVTAKERANAQEPVTTAEPAPPSGRRQPGFWDVVSAYLKALHDGICPYISFKTETAQ